MWLRPMKARKIRRTPRVENIIEVISRGREGASKDGIIDMNGEGGEGRT